VSQQLSSKAADTIYGRLEALGPRGLLAPAELAAMPDEKLRAVGLSAAKARGVKDLAARVTNATLRLDTLQQLDNQAVIDALTQVKGIGRWTAEMFLMFRLGRLDVLSTADLGLRKGMMHLFELRDLPDPERMEELAAVWRPFRSVASWYLWRVSEAAPPHRAAKPVATKAAAKKRSAKTSAAKTSAAKTSAAKKPAVKKLAAKLR
jgi:3-methyladenine DNA glycosylase/8-oxoguanine DNA glycosylase